MLNITVVFLLSILVVLGLIICMLISRVFKLEKQNIIIASEAKQVEAAEQYLRSEFENYTNKIVNTKAESLERETKANINSVILPLKEKIAEFQQKVEQTYQNESREIFSLKNELNKLILNNIAITKETGNLTKALKGDTRIQGIWGELILETILANSGLREGEEYITQGKDLKLKSEENKTLKPDVIIKLPDNKHLIIDSKVSLTHYEQYIRALDDDDKQTVQNNLNLFIKSIQNHISNLSSKKYQCLEKLSTPDFVMLFLPIEGAFSLAIQTMPELLMEAWHNKVVIVSPTTLLATLKTVDSIWQVEKQNKNAILIAKESGLLYDKLVSFTEDLTKVGIAISKADEAYHSAINKLASGRGNIISKSEKIRELGAKVSKKFGNEWQLENIKINQSDSDSDSYDTDYSHDTNSSSCVNRDVVTEDDMVSTETDG